MTAEEERLLRAVREGAGDIEDDERAREVCTAVLELLGDQLTGAAADSLADSLPDVAAVPLGRPDVIGSRERQAEGMGTGEFYAALADREGIDDQATAAGHASAVLRAIAEHGDRDAVESAREQLTLDLRRLLASEES